MFFFFSGFGGQAEPNCTDGSALVVLLFQEWQTCLLILPVASFGAGINNCTRRKLLYAPVKDRLNQKTSDEGFDELYCRPSSAQFL
jgi:hypothetical protein